MKLLYCLFLTYQLVAVIPYKCQRKKTKRRLAGFTEERVIRSTNGAFCWDISICRRLGRLFSVTVCNQFSNEFWWIKDSNRWNLPKNLMQSTGDWYLCNSLGALPEFSEGCITALLRDYCFLAFRVKSLMLRWHCELSCCIHMPSATALDPPTSHLLTASGY